MEENKKSLVFVQCMAKNYTQGICAFAALFTNLCAGF